MAEQRQLCYADSIDNMALLPWVKKCTQVVAYKGNALTL